MKKIAARLLPIFGFLFITAYIRSATVDVVYTDYIRIVNSYLPDVWSFKPYLQGDILTRVPISYIERIISTVLFDYSTTFDMFMGAVGLALSALVIAAYASKKKLSAGVILALMLIVFSLDKWEMLTNGTGWMHFWAFALFYLHYYIYDKVRREEVRVTLLPKGLPAGRETHAAGIRKKDELALYIIPPVAIMLFAGPYCAIFFGAMIVVYAYDCFMDMRKTEKAAGAETAAGAENASVPASKKTWALRFITLTVPFILFCISKYLSVDEYAGATDQSLMQVISQDITLIPRMILKSFASMVIGGETAAEYGIGNKILYLMGLFVILAYVYAIYLNIRTKLYKRTVFPILLILSGLISHAIVLWGRWIFLSPDYMMSSRYALQFQSGILGIILTLYMAYASQPKAAAGIRQEAGAGDAQTAGSKSDLRQDIKQDLKKDPKPDLRLHRVLCIIFMVIIIAGHLVTTGREIKMARYRKEAFENVQQVALNYRNETDETLKGVLQYSKPDRTREALEILETQKWNVFKNGQ